MPRWLMKLNEQFPLRYTLLLFTFIGCGSNLLLAFISQHITLWVWLWCLLVAIGCRDVLQTRHAILRNYPILGHLRFLLEYIRPEIRQYFIESDTEAEPFSRQQRSLVYQRAKNVPDKRPFGTQLEVFAAGYEWINHSLVPTQLSSHDFRVLIGADRQQPYEASLFNISGMSFGALSPNAILALNAGAQRGNFAHDTGEGAISPYHKKHGGDLVWQIASGYFGCRQPDGTFDPTAFAQQAQQPQVKMIEVKLSQGAKPGHGGVLPAAKVTPEIAAVRHIPIGQDCISPARHSAFHTPIELLEFIQQLRLLAGDKPVGIKLCIGHPWEWFAIAKAMLATHIVPDFIVIDGGEGGTGAAPVEFCDHMGSPLQDGLQLVHQTLVGLNLRHRLKIGCAGKVISAFDMARLLALGADWCNAARGFMFALGCIQAQTCHTGLCPTGVTTQDPLRQRALVVADKAHRVYHYHQNTLRALRELTEAAGLYHPNQITASHIVRRTGDHQLKLLADVLPTLQPGALLAAEQGLVPWPHEIYQRYWHQAQAESFERRELVPQTT